MKTKKLKLTEDYELLAKMMFVAFLTLGVFTLGGILLFGEEAVARVYAMNIYDLINL